MKKRLAYILLICVVGLYSLTAFAQQRFPKPEFETGHTQPPTLTPEPRAELLEIIDVAVLILSLSLITWFIIKKRSRKGVFWMSIFSIIYFGFYREGCVCSVGSLQNITLALFHPEYKIPVTVIAFFVIPLIYTLFFGRTFCAGICPLGAIQDIFVIKPYPSEILGKFAPGLIPLYLSWPGSSLCCHRNRFYCLQI